MAGGWIVDGFTATIGAAAYVAPIAFLVVGALMVARSSIVDVKPFRTGLAVTTFGLLAALGAGHGGATGRGLEGIFGLLVGSTGTTRARSYAVRGMRCDVHTIVPGARGLRMTTSSRRPSSRCAHSNRRWTSCTTSRTLWGRTSPRRS